MTDRKKLQDGFTLVEALVAMTLLSLIMMALLGSYRFGAAAWQRYADRATDPVPAARHYLAQLFERAYPLPVAGPGKDDATALFRGTNHTVTFAALQPPYPVGAGIHGFRLEIDRRDDLDRLVLSLLGRVETDLPSHAERTSVLLSVPSGLAFQYLAADGTQWQDNWTGRDTLPTRVRLASANGPPTSWTFPLRANSRADCLIRPNRNTCSTGNAE